MKYSVYREKEQKQHITSNGEQIMEKAPFDSVQN